MGERAHRRELKKIGRRRFSVTRCLSSRLWERAPGERACDVEERLAGQQIACATPSSQTSATSAGGGAAGAGNSAGTHAHLSSSGFGKDDDPEFLVARCRGSGCLALIGWSRQRFASLLYVCSGGVRCAPSGHAQASTGNAEHRTLPPVSSH